MLQHYIVRSEAAGVSCKWKVYAFTADLCFPGLHVLHNAKKKKKSYIVIDSDRTIMWINNNMFFRPSWNPINSTRIISASSWNLGGKISCRIHWLHNEMHLIISVILILISISIQPLYWWQHDRGYVISIHASICGVITVVPIKPQILLYYLVKYLVNSLSTFNHLSL